MPSPEAVKFHLDADSFEIVLAKGQLHPGTKRKYDLGNLEVFVRRPTNSQVIYLSADAKTAISPDEVLGCILSDEIEEDLMLKDLQIGGYPLNNGEKVVLHGDKSSLEVSNN